MIMPIALGAVFYIGVALALVANVFLVLSCYRIKQKNLDIYLSITLASIDLIIPSSSAVVKLLTLLPHSNNSISSYDFCAAVGAIRLLCVVMSTFLVSTISFYRYIFVAGKDAQRKFFILIWLVFGFSFGWIIFAAADGQFEKTPRSLNCAPVARSSNLAAATLSILGFSVLIFIANSIYCNFRLLLLVTQNIHTMPGFKSRTQLSPVRIRVGVAALVYTITVIPASILLIIEGILKVDHSTTALIVLYFSLGLVPLANPCLILFTHAHIHRQFKELLLRGLWIFRKKSKTGSSN